MDKENINARGADTSDSGVQHHIVSAEVKISSETIKDDNGNGIAYSFYEMIFEIDRIYHKLPVKMAVPEAMSASTSLHTPYDQGSHMRPPPTGPNIQHASTPLQTYHGGQYVAPQGYHQAGPVHYQQPPSFVHPPAHAQFVSRMGRVPGGPSQPGYPQTGSVHYQQPPSFVQPPAQYFGGRQRQVPDVTGQAYDQAAQPHGPSAGYSGQFGGIRRYYRRK